MLEILIIFVASHMNISFFFRTEQSLYTTNSLMTHFNKVMDVFFALLKEMDNY